MRVLTSCPTLRWRLLLAALVLGATSCSTNSAEAPDPSDPSDPLEVDHASIDLVGVSDVAWADLNNDGLADAVGMFREATKHVVFINEGGGQFTRLENAFEATSVGGDGRLSVADVDRDGDMDVVSDISGTVQVELNGLSEDGIVGFKTAPPLPQPGFPSIPLATDYDRDGDPDILLFPRGEEGSLTILRNDTMGSVASFSEIQGITTKVDVVEHVVEVGTGIDADLGRAQHLVYVSRNGAPDQLLELNDTTLTYEDVTTSRLDGTPRMTAPVVAVADLNKDKRPDLLVHELTHWGVWLQDEDGVFRDRANEVEGLPELEFKSPVLIAEDFDRDGEVDLFVAGDESNDHRLLLQVVEESSDPPTDERAFRFAERAQDAGLDERQDVAAAKVFLRAETCDFGVDLLVASAGSDAPSRVHLFPDDSERMTYTAEASATESIPEGGCVRGGDGDDQLFGSRVVSTLLGGAGNDRLTARAGFTVMSGGPGADTFEAKGVTLILLPLDDIAGGETIDCSDADFVFVDTPLDETELRDTGIELINCLPDDACLDAESDLTLVVRKHERPPDDVADCHEQRTLMDVFSAGLQPTAHAVLFGRGLNLVSNSGSGFGDCRTSADCYAIGLDVCRTATGSVPAPGQRGNCYPSTFSGHQGPLPEWCRDPFWARYRFEELQELFASEDRKLVIPVTFWVIRSEAATDGGGCRVVPRPTPMSITGWHDSIVNAMNTAFAFFSRWGITFDYQFRVFEVPEDSPWVIDPDDDQCRTDLEPGGTKPNSVGKLVDEFQLDVFNPGEFNVYLGDAGGVSWSSSAMVNNGTQEIKFLQLSGGAGAFVHEMGHGIGLPHPYSKNVSASGTDPDVSESRDSWLARAFPDDAIDRLRFCNTDGDCNGVDAAAGVCRKAPDASRGFCQNLKKDCGEDGDHVCDTPWDSFPCFRHVGNNEGEECTTNDDCQSESSVRGRAYLTRCGGTGHCVKAQCSNNDDCGSGSWCAGGTCVIWKEGTNSCCHISTDRGPGFDHNVCYERRPNGNVVQVAGVGASTSWPFDDNAMAYHKPFGRKRTFTDGQRDQSVCKTSYRTDFGPILRKPNDPTDGPQACSLRPGAIAFDYGDVGETRLIPHGACVSGVCALTDAPAGTIALCTESTCTDGVKGEGEASVDCGGVCPVPCPTSREEGPSSSQCADDDDCASGSCRQGTCQATCEDGIQNGSELDEDSGGASFDTTCGTQANGEVCRYDDDCGGASSFCRDEGTCVLSADCPVNEDVVACVEDIDCNGGGECLIMRRLCENTICITDAQCATGICQLPEGRCVCETVLDCITASDACSPSQSMCLDQCVDGRCLGECTFSIGF